jgi:phage tail protein X
MAVELKSELNQIRATPSQGAAFRRTTKTDGLRLSAWLREVGTTGGRTFEAPVGGFLAEKQKHLRDATAVALPDPHATRSES